MPMLMVLFKHVDYQTLKSSYLFSADELCSASQMPFSFIAKIILVLTHAIAPDAAVNSNISGAALASSSLNPLVSRQPEFCVDLNRVCPDSNLFCYRQEAPHLGVPALFQLLSDCQKV
jgi:hypothetical protein